MVASSSRSTSNNYNTNLCASSDHSQQLQQQQQQQSRPRTYSDPWNPNPFSASSGLENGNGGGEYDYQRQQLHRRGKQDTKFACSVPGCGSTFTRRSGEQKQVMIQKRRQTEVQIFGLGGPYQIALLPSLIMPPFSDLSSSHLLRLMLACYSSSHRTLCSQSHFFIRCVPIAFQLPVRE